MQFQHITECLYFYRIHAKNNVKTNNAEIRHYTNQVYNAHIWKLAEKFANDNKLSLIDLCGGLDAPTGYIPIDKSIRAPANTDGIYSDLDHTWALENDSVGVLRAHDAIEHLRNPIHTMNEAYRVLAPGGFFLISVPSTNGLGAFCDPTHVSFWNKLSFRYYVDRQFSRYVPEFIGRFQVSRVIEWFPSEWHKQENVPYVEAHLICLKSPYEPMGEVLI
jgi:SAM-dependent methyltransferase